MLRRWGDSGRVFSTVTGHNIRISLNARELVSNDLLPALGTTASFAYDFQGQKQETAQVKLVLLNEALLVWLTWFLSAQGIFKVGFRLFLILTTSTVITGLVGFVFRLAVVFCSSHLL